MLILARKVGQTVVIDDDITVVVKDIKGNQIRFGVNAPDDVAIHPEEIHKKIQAEERAKQQIKET